MRALSAQRQRCRDVRVGQRSGLDVVVARGRILQQNVVGVRSEHQPGRLFEEVNISPTTGSCGDDARCRSLRQWTTSSHSTPRRFGLATAAKEARCTPFGAGALQRRHQPRIAHLASPGCWPQTATPQRARQRRTAACEPDGRQKSHNTVLVCGCGIVKSWQQRSFRRWSTGPAHRPHACATG